MSQSQDGDSGVWVPFTSHIDYEVARWAKLRGQGSTAFSDLLNIEGVCKHLGISYQNSRTLNNIIDSKIPAHRPHFKRQEILVAGEAFDVYFWDILQCVKALYGDPELAPYLPGATIIPILLSSDKTQVTMFRNKAAYPIYMTIGNLPKEIRRQPSRNAQILVGYLPTTKLEHITNKAARRWCLANLFHACVCHIVEPLIQPGKDGMPIASGDGVLRRGHPLLACYIGDYPEQLLVTGMKTGECPKCDIPLTELGSKDLPFEMHDLHQILDALALVDEDPSQFAKACRDTGFKLLYHPFWQGLPHCNIYNAITPMFSTRYIKASGMEHQQICRFLLGIIIDIWLPDGASPVRLIRAVRGLLDFLYLAQYPCRSDLTLELLSGALNRFHDNKSIFVDLGICSSFNLPKLHSFQHYLAKHPSVKRVMFASLVDWYGTIHFQVAVARFVVQLMQPGLSARQAEEAACHINLPFQSVAVFHKVRYSTTLTMGCIRFHVPFTMVTGNPALSLSTIFDILST
ncbi:hypothetical protein CY34DRAFT_26919 [Suillus luteus UH-Slu-Lm8-n1]|uniref:Uncharacterized protein n=1 Tax=Suillus luteus UH-Slu-Lm8-n1 TaxID=930992 RepID=A0A0D0A7L1_9AGAM|nr:hypothetical protein CY34DRAFT_26919 [Suillus luteus UH-Slu-Lm8-n1]